MEPIDNTAPDSARLPPSNLHTIFLGPHGLRTGWRLAIYLGAFIGLLFAFRFVVSSFLPQGQGAPLWVFLVGECELLAAGVIPAVTLASFEHRRFDDYGLPRRGAFGRNFWAGVVWGFLAITILLVSMRGLGIFYFGDLALHGVRVVKFAAFWGVLFLLVGFAEEFVTRGYSQFTLAQGIGFWPAALLLSCAFGALHLENQGEAVIGAVSAAFIGMFFCLTLRRTGNLWFAVGMHATWDWGESFFYSVPDSGQVAPGHLLKPSFHGSRWLTGGSVGPEGSVLVFVLIAVMWIVFDRVYPANRSTEQSANRSV